MSKFLWLLIALVIVGGTGISQEGAESEQRQSCEAEISARHIDSNLAVTGKFINHAADSMSATYELRVLRLGMSGRSSSRQSGAFTVPPGETIDLSSTTVNITPDDFYKIILTVLAEDKQVIASDSVIYPERKSP